VTFKSAIDSWKAGLGSVFNAKDGHVLKGTGSWKNYLLNLKTVAKYPLGVGIPEINAEAVIEYPKEWHWGASARYLHNGTVWWNAKAGYGAKGQQLAVLCEYKKNDKKEDTKPITVTTLGYHQVVSESTKFAASFTVEEHKTIPTTVQFGGEYKVDSNTTVKSKVNVSFDNSSNKAHDFRLGLGLKQNLSHHLVATVGADLNVRHICGQNFGNAHSFGCEIKFSE